MLKASNKNLIPYGWKVLLVECNPVAQAAVLDDLGDFTFESRGLTIFKAQDITEAKKILALHPNMDVVLSGGFSGLGEEILHLVQHVRKKMHDQQMRFILLIIPELLSQDLIIHYDLRIFSREEKFLPETLAGFLTLVLNELKFLKRFARLKQKTKTRLDAAARFVPKPFVKLLNKESITQVNLGDCAEREMTVLFLDIRAFSEISAFLTPLETFQFINHCMSYFEPVIVKHNGFVDKYIGDALMALFPGKADDAVMAGIEMQKVLQDYNNKRMEQYQRPIRVGIGINTGLLAMGVVGTRSRMDCTVMSDAVNMAARLEKLNKQLGSQLLFSEYTFHQLEQKSEFRCRYVGKFHLLGKTGVFGVYESFDANSERLMFLKQQTLQDFNQAVQLYQTHRFEEAWVLFKQIEQINAQDGAVQYFLERLR